MVKYALAATAVTLMMSGSAFAVAPLCQEQLSAVQQRVERQADKKAQVQDKLKQAQQQCQSGQEEAAQQSIREVREAIGDKDTDMNAQAAGGSGMKSTQGQSKQ